MKFELRAYQNVAVDHALEGLLTAHRGFKRCYSAPTGSGKSVIELALKEALERNGRSCWIVTPRDEIIDGLMDKAQAEGDPADHGLWTPVKLRNRLLDGRLTAPDFLVYDEGHHHEAEVWQQLDLLTGLAPAVAYTATPYRGSPRGTREFREKWGDPISIITYKEAIAEGYIALPEFSVLPLVDDDIVEVKGGEFDVTSIDAATVDRLGDMADHARAWHDGELWDKPTIFSLPTTAACIRLHQELAERGLPSAIVNAATPKSVRPGVFQAVVGGVLALLHINVVTEGVDLPLRRLVDLAPTLSPVKWVQQLGRIMRPGGHPEYVCTNRNIMRHSYILEDVVPVSAVAETEKKFGPTQRGHTRVLGLEAIGRFRPASVKLSDGCHAYMYSLSTVAASGITVDYCCIVHPTRDPIWATKVSTRNEDGTKSWGTWQSSQPPADLKGFSTVAPKSLSEKQARWWARSAASFGLDPEQPVDRKNFQVLPVLKDTGERL